MAQDGGMRLRLLAIAPTCAAALAAAAPLRADDSVTIYRCTDARGKVVIEKFNPDGSPMRATDTAMPPAPTK